ncbi:proteasome regulatory particle base subunit rpn10 [Marasmius crinis-equi]|uniref:Proteasome regulatory particle base subunit rpn10 n=1 Tax=Marasmius crinis-equi TaxID=585013 RepID=A0ABR3FKD9_9AGAR
MVTRPLKSDMQSPDFDKHTKYCFEDANVSFIVEDRLRFDVHRHFLQRDSEFFKRMLSGRPNAPDGTYYVPGLKIYQFESLLDFFYDGMYFISPATMPIKYWINLLSVSTTFDFPRARDHAIAAIDLCQVTSNTIEPARIIEIANLYGVEKWLEPAYAALAEREEMVSAGEAKMVGMKGLLVIMNLREMRLRETIRCMSREQETFRYSNLQEDGAVPSCQLSPAPAVLSPTLASITTPSFAPSAVPPRAPSIPPSRTPSVIPLSLPSRTPSPRAPFLPQAIRPWFTPPPPPVNPLKDEIIIGHEPTREDDKSDLEVQNIPRYDHENDSEKDLDTCRLSTESGDDALSICEPATTHPNRKKRKKRKNASLSLSTKIPLEATMMILDDSEYIRNGDYQPTRFDAQADAVNMVFQTKIDSNPENTVGVMSMAGKGSEVLVTHFKDLGQILHAIHKTSNKIGGGEIDIPTVIAIAQLALKYRRNKNLSQRTIVFVGSPSQGQGANEKGMVKLAKKFKKNDVAVDVVCFGDGIEEVTREGEGEGKTVLGSSAEAGAAPAVPSPSPSLHSLLYHCRRLLYHHHSYHPEHHPSADDKLYDRGLPQRDSPQFSFRTGWQSSSHSLTCAFLVLWVRWASIHIVRFTHFYTLRSSSSSKMASRFLAPTNV